MPEYSSYNDNYPLSGTGKGGFAVALAALIVLTLLTGNVEMRHMITASHGVCFPTPEMWQLNAGLAYWLNLGLTVGAALYSVVITHRFNFLPVGNILYASVLMLLCGCIPLFTGGINSGILLLWTILLSTHILFALYGSKNSSEGVFLVFSILSWGSMFHTSAILLMPIFLLAAVFIRSVRLKEIIAMLFGIVTPYWILLACGIVGSNELHMPRFSNMFTDMATPMQFLQLLLIVGITGLIFLFMMLLNVMRSESAGVVLRARRSFINLLGFALLWFIIFDFGNIMTYLPALYLCVGYETALWSTHTKSSQRIYILPAFLLLTIALYLI